MTFGPSSWSRTPLPRGLGAAHLVAEQGLDHALDPVPEPPGAARAEHGAGLGDADALREQPERLRGVPDRAAPAFAQLVGGPDEVPEPAERLGVGLDEVQCGLADDQPGVGARLVEQGRGLQRRLPSADHRDPAALERLQPVDVLAVREQVRGQPGQLGRDPVVGQHAGRHHDLPGGDRVRVGEADPEPALDRGHVADRDVPDARDQLLGEPVGVTEEAFPRQRAQPLLVVVAVLGAVGGHVIAGPGRGHVRGVRLRLHVHADRHVRAVGAVRLAHDLMADAERAQMGRDGQAERAGPDDENFLGGHVVLPCWVQAGLLVPVSSVTSRRRGWWPAVRPGRA